MHCLSPLLLGLIFISQSLGQGCNSERGYELHLGSKTPYRTVANINTSVPQFEGCKPKKAWMIVRHGTRNPSAGFITQMKERLPEIRDLILLNNVAGTHLLNSDLDNLRKWRAKLEETEEKRLVHEGEDEMIALSERMQTRYPELFPPIYSNTSFFFKYTSSQRTKASAKYFAAGLFGKKTVADVWFPKPSKADPILRFYKSCSKWKTDIKNNPDVFEEVRKFENGKYMVNALKSLNKILNLDDDLSQEDLHLMYMICAFESAWNKRKRSPWCSVLTDESIKVSEFLEDIKYYYQDGYAHELTYKQACPAFKDAISFFESPSEFPKATVYFTHSGTLLKMLAHVGLYKDAQHLTYLNYKSQDHKWKTSQIDSFGTNLAFILYDCDGNRKMLTLHQEHVVQLPGCENLCDLSDIKKLYSESLNNCAFEEMCTID